MQGAVHAEVEFASLHKKNKKNKEQKSSTSDNEITVFRLTLAENCTINNAPNKKLCFKYVK